MIARSINESEPEHPQLLIKELDRSRNMSDLNATEIRTDKTPELPYIPSSSNELHSQSSPKLAYHDQVTHFA